LLGRTRAAVERLRQQLPVLLRLLAPELLVRVRVRVRDRVRVRVRVKG